MCFQKNCLRVLGCDFFERIDLSGGIVELSLLQETVDDGGMGRQKIRLCVDCLAIELECGPLVSLYSKERSLEQQGFMIVR